MLFIKKCSAKNNLVFLCKSKSINLMKSITSIVLISIINLYQNRINLKIIITFDTI